MNSTLLNNVVRFIALLLLQVFVMDEVNFMGYISPLVYLLFIVLYPVDNNRWSFLILSFLLGLIVDTFQDTGGAHAAASLTLAFVRPVLLKLVYGEGYLTKNLKILKSPLDRFSLLLVLGVLIHHLILYLLIYFNISQVLQVLQMTLFIGLSSIFMGVVLFVLFGWRNKS
ncbi:hypothetical protein [Nonlabens ulvanivorans]|uniref:Membrane protein n=1 Tax=Nonlabens ulvanivorans TaxID=906888 RepID=A0A084JSV1_NONUL|nr:hypothetical protein [Nonlabens ulvanivorans]KEZ92035.1 membrane protein [Nonlabens ulvanivorans]PRX14863.1 hypothetical protein LY02_00072 [Nonlabens ulvanivorans]